MAVKALQGDDLADRLAILNSAIGSDWTIVDGKLHREYQFNNFVTAFGFMSQVALIAERADHHPEWFNVYRTVRVDLTTHDAGGISVRDFELAAAMDHIAAPLPQ